MKDMSSLFRSCLSGLATLSVTAILSAIFIPPGLYAGSVAPQHADSFTPHIRINSSNGEGLGHARVIVCSSTSVEKPEVRTADGAGLIKLDGIAPGTYDFEARSPNFLTFSGKQAVTRVTGIKIGPQGDRSSPALRSITVDCGRVAKVVTFDEAGERITTFGLMVCAVTGGKEMWVAGGGHLWKDGSRPSIYSEADGEVVLSGLPETGTLKLAAFGLREPQRFGVSDVELEGKKSSLRIDIMLKIAQEVRVFIRDEEGHPVNRVEARSLNTAYDGSMWFEKEVVPGTYEKRSWEFIRPRDAVNGEWTILSYDGLEGGLFVFSEVGGCLIQQPANIVGSPIITLRARNVVCGTVVYEEKGDAVIGAHVRLTLQGGKAREAYCDAKGHFVIYVGADSPVSIEIEGSRFYHGTTVKVPRLGVPQRIVVKKR